MIRTFRHKGLAGLWTKGTKKGLAADQVSRIERLLDRLDAAALPADMNVPGFGFHALKGKRKGEFAVTVTGNWRLTFYFDGDDAVDVDLVDYH